MATDSYPLIIRYQHGIGVDGVSGNRRVGVSQYRPALRGRLRFGAVPGQDGIKDGEERVS